MINSFNESGLKPEILEAIQAMGFETPTPIQAQTIPFLLSNKRDLIGLAQTGTGKTAAFGLPSLHLTEVDNRETQTLILCPTRELCLQITKDLENYSKNIKGMNIVPVYGGASIETQIRLLRKGAQVVVGTPGRTKDLINRGKLKHENISRLILDEADEMLSMGFKDDLDAILENTPEEKQTLLFSATMSREIARITKTYMTDPEQIEVAGRNVAADNVEHIFYMVQARDRYEVLKRIADVNPDIYGIVFCRTRQETKDIARKFMEDGYNAGPLHGDLSQAQRDEAMDLFRRKQLQILVATDVAARGIDVNDLTHVINYNLPEDTEAYVHRSGRTGRAGKKGISIAIVHTREGRKMREVEKAAGIKFKREKVPGGEEIVAKQLLSFIDKVGSVNVEEAQIEPFLPAIYEKMESLSREELIKKFVTAEFTRFLDYYKNARDINVDPKNVRDDHRGDRNDRGRRGDRRDRGERRERGDRGDRGDRRERGDRGDRGGRFSNTNFARLYVNLGTNHKLNPTRLIGLINETLRSNNSEIGKIEILKNFSFFEIEDKLKSNLIDGMIGKKFEGRAVLLEESEGKGERGDRGDRGPRSGARPGDFKKKREKRPRRPRT